MSYKTKPQIKLYAFQNNAFVLQAIIDDYQECSFEANRFEAGQFSITINYNIPNALLFQRGLWVQFGNDSYMFGEILNITDSIGADGKGSQIRNITGYDARYIFKRRIIKNLNNVENWNMTAKGELVMRNLIKDQCGSGAEVKRQLPIINIIPSSSSAIGSEYSVAEAFTNLYEVLVTIATQSEIGWRIKFDGNLTLEFYEGEDRHLTVRFDTDYESLANGEFTDSAESFANAVFVGGKGTGSERDIYEGEMGTESPAGLDRYEAWDNQSSMTTEDEYEAEALSVLSQYGQTLMVSGNGLAKCPYEYGKEYNVGDIITIAFSGKSAVVQILSVIEHWTWGGYDLEFSFGKPQPDLNKQLQLMLRKIQGASNKTNATESVKWYNVANVNSMPASDVTFNTIGFTGTMTANKTFTFYLDDEKTGAKSYNIYVKNLSGNYSLTLTTGRSGKTNYVLKGGVNLTGRILVDDEGNITSQSLTATSTIEAGNNQPATSGGVYNYLFKEIYTGSSTKYLKFSNIFPNSASSGNAFLLTLRNREAYLLFLSTTDSANPHKPTLLKISDLYTWQTTNTPSPSLNNLRNVSYNLSTREIILTVNNYVNIGIRQIGGLPASLEYTTVTEAFTDNVTPSKILDVPEPTTDGDYALQCNVSSRVPSYSWKSSLTDVVYKVDFSTYNVPANGSITIPLSNWGIDSTKYTQILSYNLMNLYSIVNRLKDIIISLVASTGIYIKNYSSTAIDSGQIDIKIVCRSSALLPSNRSAPETKGGDNEPIDEPTEDER